MFKYFFILGRNRALSIAELFSYFTREKIIKIKPLFLEKEAFLVELERRIDLSDLRQKLGGIVKCGHIFLEEEKGQELSKTLRQILSLEKILENSPKVNGKKLYLGYSLYVKKKKIFKKTKDFLFRHFIQLKRELKKKDLRVRIVSSQKATLSSVVIKKNKLISQGLEINVFIFGAKIFLGRTEEIQNFEEYSFRDYQRPARDMKIGMLPPKLARMMVNISGAKISAKLLDPFCGCGTILQEAILLGFRKLLGADISSLSLKKTAENLKWLFKKYDLTEEEIKWKLFESDIKEIDKKIKGKIDAVVTEPYLSPLLKRELRREEARGIIKKLVPLYLNFFKSMGKILQNKGVIVIVWPVFKLKRGYHKLEILREVLSMGFQQKDILPAEMEKFSFPEKTRRGSIIYSRPKQNVLREIFIFQKIV